MKIERVPGESNLDWLMRKYGSQIEELYQKVGKLEAKRR